MTALSAPRPVCFLGHFVVEVSENKNQTKNDTEFPKNFLPVRHLRNQQKSLLLLPPLNR